MATDYNAPRDGLKKLAARDALRHEEPDEEVDDADEVDVEVSGRQRLRGRQAFEVEVVARPGPAGENRSHFPRSAYSALTRTVTGGGST